MTEISIPVQSKKTLLKATGYAGVVATVLAITVILPAEYGVDPTGIGKAFGLTDLAAPAVPVTVSGTKAADGPAMEYRTDTVTVSVPRGKDLEYKFHMLEGGNLKYSWSTEQGELYYDFHGEPKGDTTGYFESFSESTTRSGKGSHTAPFTGSHGWYWRNEGTRDVIVTLTTSGSYKVKGLSK